MKALLLFLTAIFLSSCVHTAVAPVSDGDGVQVVIPMRGVRLGQEPTREQRWAMAAKFYEASSGRPAPGYAATKPVGKKQLGYALGGNYGDAMNKRGEKFVAYAPAIRVRQIGAADEVDRNALLEAVRYYRAAKKAGLELIPVTELKPLNNPKKP